MAEVENFSINEHGIESHPAFALIGASRISIGPPGSVLFDSDILHNHTVRIHIKPATRKRNLNSDWIHGTRGEYIEVELSEAQWASFVSSMNVGDGVPCTLRHLNHVDTPELPYEPRMALSIKETSNAAHRSFDAIEEALAVYDKALVDKAPAVERREALGKLRAVISNAVPNVNFAGKSLVEYTENVVTKARADIEAFVTSKARQLGLDVTELSGPNAMALGWGDDED